MELEVHNFDDYYQQSYSSPVFAALEKGLLQPIDFFDGFRQETGLALSNQQIETAWNAMLGHFRPQSLAILPALKLQYRTYLFSNTNSIHYQYFVQYCQTSTGLLLNQQFHKAYYSHLFGQRKPDAASYQFILEENGLLPSETLFIDDTLKNIEGAKAVGLQTLWLQANQMVEVELPKYLMENE